MSAEFDLGETCKVGILSVTEGHDKPGKYPLLFHEISALVLNKIDLLPYTDFNYDQFVADFRKLNATAPIFQVSCKARSRHRAMGALARTRCRPANSTSRRIITTTISPT